MRTLTYGFAIFAMFFGSGNLVFPIELGQKVGANWLLSWLGLFVTGIMLPFFGLFVIKIHRGNYNSFFAEAGIVAKIILPLFILSLLGSFGVIPRCITVAYNGVKDIVPSLPIAIFSLIFCVACYITCLKENVVINILGKWMTPVLLILLSLLIILGIINAPHLPENFTDNLQSDFTSGFLVGYQTMDLFAAFFFSSLVFSQIQATMPKNISTEEVIKATIVPSMIGAGLLAAVYLGFVFLGAHYQSSIMKVAPEMLLPTIARKIVGPQASFVIAIIITFSCLTTAIALNNIYARYLCNLLKLQNKHFTLVLLTTTIISFLVSLLDFQGIASFLVPLLKISYPSLIALTILSICTNKCLILKRIVFYGLLIVMLIAQAI